MIQFTVGTEIARPPSEVFAHVTDPAKLATWQTNTNSAVAESDQPFGLGTRVREVHRAPGGKQLASLVEVSRIRARLRVRAADARRSATHPRPDHARTHQARHPRPARRARTTERPDAPRPTPPTPHPQTPVRRLLRHAQTGARDRPPRTSPRALKLLGPTTCHVGKHGGPTTQLRVMSNYRERTATAAVRRI